MPEWVHRPISALGGNTAEGESKVLGRPEFDPLTVMIREAAQNSWDARLKDEEGPVRFSVEHKTIQGDVAEAWKGLFGSHGGDHVPATGLRTEESWSVLFVSDRGTTGLGGPTRAD